MRCSARRPWPALPAVFAALFAGAALAAEDDLFVVLEIPSARRVTAAELLDLDGDQLGDLLTVTFTGLPPAESRQLEVRFQRDDGRLPFDPDWTAPLPAGTSFYDIGELAKSGPDQLLVLAQGELSVLSLAGRKPGWRRIALPKPSMAVTEDERGIDRLDLVQEGLGPGPRILVPGLGESSLLEADGALVARLESGARANFFVPRSGPVVSESEVEVYLDAPRMSAVEIDGDGRLDLVASSRHELRIFLQREDGSFPNRPDRSLALNRISKEDHIRQSGSVRTILRDFDGDGRADLILGQTEGSLLRGRARITLHRNRDGSFDLDSPDQVFASDEGQISNQLADLDGDGRPELLEVRLTLGVLDIVQFLISQKIDADIAAYAPRAAGDGAPFQDKTAFRREVSVGFSFDTMRTLGFIPTLDHDVDGDGYLDLLSSGDGDEIEFFPGGANSRYKKRKGRQELDSGGRLRPGDLDADDRIDFVLYDPRRPEVPIRILRNRSGFTMGAGRSSPERASGQP